MGQKKIGMAVAAAVAVTLVAVVAAITVGSSGSTKLTTTASQATGTKPAAAGDPAAMIMGGEAPIVPATMGGAPGMPAPITAPAHPTAEDVKRVLAGITAQILAPPSSTASTKPLTKEQVESQVREQLRQLGINF